MIWNCRVILAVSCEDFEEVLNLIFNQNVLVLHMIDVLLSLTFPWMSYGGQSTYHKGILILNCG